MRRAGEIIDVHEHAYQSYYLLLCIADLGLACLLFTNLQYFSMVAMLGLFALAGIACFAFLVPESGAECPGALLIVPLFASVAITAYDFAFSLVPAHYYGLALHALLLISIATFVSVTVIYLLGRGNIYASWANQSGYEAKLMNMSKGCLYLDYSGSCYINSTTPNTGFQCYMVTKMFKMYPIVSMRLDNYS